MDIIETFRRAARRAPQRTFLFDAETLVTYREADRKTDSIAADLISRGICDGATLGLSSPDRVDLWLAIIGAWKAGALPGLIDARTQTEDLPYFVTDVGAKTVLAASELVELYSVEGGGTVSPDRHGPHSPLYLSYTSGTTGPPKGAVLRSEPVTLGTACIAERLGLTGSDVLLATTPISSSFQLVAALMPAIHVGASVGLVAGRSVGEIWDIAHRTRATVLVAYPLTLADVVNAPAAVQGDSPFRLALSGGSPLAPRIKRDFRDRLGIHLLESYGQSELGGFMALGSERDGERAMAGYVGRSLPDRLAYVGDSTGSEVSSGEVGEVMVTHGYFSEYRNKPEETGKAKAGGVLHTGDLAVSDPDGYIKVLGRTREADGARRRGGFLRELEDAYYDHPDVLHATVVEGASGAVEAFVELMPGRSATAGDIEGSAASRVAKGLAPHKTTILQKMPRTFSGKADRRKLADRIR
jgi:acyl-CoA synthetase (AMP-forming)/AMP-acid ligase II